MQIDELKRLKGELERDIGYYLTERLSAFREATGGASPSDVYVTMVEVSTVGCPFREFRLASVSCDISHTLEGQ